MATLRDIRTRIKAVKSTSKITSAMKMVAAAKLKRAQQSIESARPYFGKLEEIMANLIATIGTDYEHEFISKREKVNNLAVIVVSSDRGLCGGFNSILFRDVANYINTQLKELFPNANIKIIPIGKKAVTFFKKRNYNLFNEFPGLFNDLNFDVVKQVLTNVTSDYINGKFDKVLVYYNRFISTVNQKPTLEQILPLKANELVNKGSGFTVDYIFEPDRKQILDELIPKIVDLKLWKAMLESNAAEQAARMLAMDTATTNAKNLVNVLELQYNKARQAAITTEMLEIVGGAEALRAS